MSKHKIAVLPGDGIGPEIMAATISVLKAVEKMFPELELALTEHSAGARHWLETGDVLPANVLDDCLDSDAVLFAAVGLPGALREDGTEATAEMMMTLRRRLELYAAVRPVKLYPGVKSPLSNTEKGIDFIVLRENTEGLFASYGGGYVVDDNVAGDNLVITRKGTERVVEYAHKLAKRRNGRPVDGRKMVTCVDKANVFRSFAFFRKVFSEVAERYSDIDAETAYVDAMSLLMVEQPEMYDVLVMENIFGDILSDLGAALVGGLGLAPSGEVGDNHALFQPSHGSAPGLMGQDAANPLAMILSSAMMLDWLGERHGDAAAVAAGQAIEEAVSAVLVEGKTLPQDQGGSAGTKAVGAAIIERLAALPVARLAS